MIGQLKRVKSETLILIGFVLALSLGAFMNLNIWTSQGQREDQLNMRRSLDQASRWTNLKISALSSDLRTVLKEESALRQESQQFDFSPPLGQTLKTSSFLAVGVAGLNAQGVWAPVWLSAVNPVQSWGKNELPKIIPLLPLGEVSEAKTTITKIVDPSGQPIIAVLKKIILKNDDHSYSVAIGLLPMNEFASLSVPFKGSGLKLILTDSTATAYAMPEQQSVGNQITRHPIWMAYNKLSAQLSFKFDDNEGESLALAYAPPQTNLLIFVYSELRGFWNYLSTFFWPFVLLISALSLGFYAIVKYFKINWGDLALQMSHVPTPNDYTKIESAQPASVVQGISSIEAMLKLKTTVAGIAHRFNVPLLGILGQIQLAKVKKADKDVLTHLDFVESEARSLKMQVDQMLKWSEVDKSKRSPFDLNVAIEQSIKSFKKEPFANDVKVSSSSSVKEAMLVGSMDAFKQAIAGLLKNSAEAMLESDEKEINLRLTKESDRLKLTIEDTGKGISSSQQDKIFDPLYTTKHSASEVGIGLTFGLSIAKSMGGRLYFEPKLLGVSSGGAKFIFDLPASVTDIDVKISSVSEPAKLEVPQVTTNSAVGIPDSMPDEKLDSIAQMIDVSNVPDIPIALNKSVPESFLENKVEIIKEAFADNSVDLSKSDVKSAETLPQVEISLSKNLEKLSEKIKFKVRAPKASTNKELNP